MLIKPSYDKCKSESQSKSTFDNTTTNNTQINTKPFKKKRNKDNSLDGVEWVPVTQDVSHMRKNLNNVKNLYKIIKADRNKQLRMQNEWLRELRNHKIFENLFRSRANQILYRTMENSRSNSWNRNLVRPTTTSTKRRAKSRITLNRPAQVNLKLRPKSRSNYSDCINLVANNPNNQSDLQIKFNPQVFHKTRENWRKRVNIRSKQTPVNADNNSWEILNVKLKAGKLFNTTNPKVKKLKKLVKSRFKVSKRAQHKPDRQSKISNIKSLIVVEDESDHTENTVWFYDSSSKKFNNESVHISETPSQIYKRIK